MKAIITLQNPDGSYDEVGMNNRRVFGPLRSESTLLARLKSWAGKKAFRAEIFNGDSIYSTPARTLFVEGAR